MSEPAPLSKRASQELSLNLPITSRNIEVRFNMKKRMNMETRAKRMQDVDNLEYMGKEKEEDEKANVLREW
ncbi:hypothetical protein C346_00386 [Cryptococcus neoformans D17-1]|nr:hypothetical protein C346_00386 [Cryptococcus neoformans var. grubii D17-1]